MAGSLSETDLHGLDFFGIASCLKGEDTRFKHMLHPVVPDPEAFPGQAEKDFPAFSRLEEDGSKAFQLFLAGDDRGYLVTDIKLHDLAGCHASGIAYTDFHANRISLSIFRAVGFRTVVGKGGITQPETERKLGAFFQIGMLNAGEASPEIISHRNLSGMTGKVWVSLPEGE